ncbi:unnamed protein product [Bemisia tabaci]|uniref:G patch domain-containing protein 11 n=1 Tax=Bemisia tabaci TaxID=7038 RepID=A0A9N9ZXJ6_BEMTA|nr:unnamed protein product [Bemisia tabaci]
MESDEPDYMSDDFLANHPTEDVRPGLLMSRAKKREHEAMKRSHENQEQQKLLNKKLFQQKTRAEGLNKPIDSTNKGYALLQKMGYKPGTGIGKNETGRTEPIGISIKNDRKGLGRENAIKEVNALKVALGTKRMRTESISVDDYRARVAAEAAERQANGDLRSSQRVCYELDSKEGTTEPLEAWFWPPREEETKEDDEREEDISESDSDEDIKELTVLEKLKLVTVYLRSAHLYCVWCGVQYDNSEDLDQSCPGSTREDH